MQDDFEPDAALPLKARLNRARVELLDLSNRNRLLDVPRRSNFAKTIEVVDELSPEIWRLLVVEEKAMTFDAGSRQAAGADGGDEVADLAQPGDEVADERGIAQRHSDTRLQTRLTSEGLQKRLLALHYDARTLQEEQGVNILFLALGMLKWFEDEKSDKERYAPLILIPVTLERGTAAEKFKLRRLPDDLTPNLSLEALLKRQFGLDMPEFGDADHVFDPAEYCARVADAVSSQRRWAVLPNDVVLGFFSFAKFLMYRDLDPATWPGFARFDDHPVLKALFGDGFSKTAPLIDEEEFIDDRLDPADLVHIMDADSSQTIAIHEALSSRHLVIQGPPGTGKSQTISNIVAALVAKGKRVLFVAEKMAALEVVKRRLDRSGVGDICLELHSHKANKRSVLAELRRTWELGRPNGGGGDAISQLEQLRAVLNAHPERLHRRHEPSGLTAYQVIGHMVKLSAAGHPPADAVLDGPENWTQRDKDDRALQLKELAARVADFGLPTAHPWRGVCLPLVLPNQVHRLVQRLRDIAPKAVALLSDQRALVAALGLDIGASLADCVRSACIGEACARAPSLPAEAFAATCWDDRVVEVSALVELGAGLAETRSALRDIVLDAAWDTDLTAARQQIAIHGDEWLRGLSGEYGRAVALFKSVLAGPPPKALADRLSLLDRIIAARKAAVALAAGDGLGREAFRAAWRGEKSDWPLLRGAVDWFRANPPGEALAIRRALASVADRRAAGEIAGRIASAGPALQAALTELWTELDLDLHIAFGVGAPAAIDLQEIVARLDAWVERPEDLSKWIAYKSKAETACMTGLRSLVERLADGRLTERTVVPEFEMAFYDALLAKIAGEDPAIAQFDGNGHDRLVDAFRQADLGRIRLARFEVAAAHHAAMPYQDGAAGPIGVLKGEFVRKRGHLPIRQLMKKAGAAIQAIKPVFMMSPHSIAQFLEPGAVDFDVLVIDEASQIQPVDALGAIARCKQVVVVGDDRQLPPTSFFNRILAGDDGDDEVGASASLGDIESILGLCIAKGMPSRMLRWHYRSRHQSLIAVSNRQFYENRLFIVPSPYTSQAGMGLRFHHIPHGTFDRVDSGVNQEEARTVAEAVIRHAHEQPELSLGVATFSIKQRRAVVDELERLRRLNPGAEAFFAAHPDEPFFVKNLENVQGDERDVVFVSVGYGRSPEGYMSMNFGPLNRDGGERRLNVLISRAKLRCEVYASITDEDLDLERAGSPGIFALKLFLNFARTGKLGIATRSGHGYDSVFEEQVAAALIARGYDVHPQVGVAGFFIDLAIADFDRPGRYVLGIECDGASYHSSRSARDRDRLRQAVLEEHGWIIHRIWSTDWFHRPQEQLAKTIAAIEAAKAELDSRAEESAQRSRAVPVEIVTVARKDAIEVGLSVVEAALSVPYREASIVVPQGVELPDLPAETMADIVVQVVQAEGPIHRDEIVTRIRGFWKLQRMGSRIKSALERGMAAAAQAGAVVEQDGFYAVSGAAPAIRDRSVVTSPSLRKPELLPPAEIRAAALSFVERNLGATRDELIIGISRMLGFKATGAQLAQVLEAVILAIVAEGLLGRQGDRLVPQRGVSAPINVIPFPIDPIGSGGEEGGVIELGEDEFRSSQPKA